MTKSNIYDLASLHREKDRLNMQIEQTEKELSAARDYFRAHYKGIIWSWLNPFDGKNTFSQVLGIAKSAILPEIATLSIDDLKSGKLNHKSLAGIGAALAIRLVQKFLKKKSGKENDDITENNA